MSTSDVDLTPALGGRYRLGELLGRGGVASVYRAHDLRLDRDVAVKVFHGADGSREQSARWRSEARLLATVSHPGLVAVYDAAEISDAEQSPLDPYLVMELVDGVTLAHELRTGPLTRQDVADIGMQLSAALAYIHRRGIVHRDVKPANILLKPAADAPQRWQAKLTDFGIARFLDESRVTMTGEVIGTANYLSPEQANGTAVDERTDIYSLGLVLLECLTGEVAYPGHGIAAACARLNREPWIPATVPAQWTVLLREMTALDASARPNADGVWQRLASLSPAATSNAPTSVLPRILLPAEAFPAADVGSAGFSAAGGATASVPPVRRRRRGLTIAVVGACALGALCGVLVGTLSSGHSAAPAATVGLRHVSGSAPTPGGAASANTAASSAPNSPVPHSSAAEPAAISHAPSIVTPVVSNAGEAIAQLRMAIAAAESIGDLQAAAANDLRHRLDGISHALAATGPTNAAGDKKGQAKGPGGKGGKHADAHGSTPPAKSSAAELVRDLANRLSTLRDTGQLSLAGYTFISGRLAVLRTLVPAGGPVGH